MSEDRVEREVNRQLAVYHTGAAADSIGLLKELMEGESAQKHLAQSLDCLYKAAVAARVHYQQNNAPKPGTAMQS